MGGGKTSLEKYIPKEVLVNEYLNPRITSDNIVLKVQ